MSTIFILRLIASSVGFILLLIYIIFFPVWGKGDLRMLGGLDKFAEKPLTPSVKTMNDKRLAMNGRPSVSPLEGEFRTL